MCVFWELGWIEESMDLLSLLPFLGMVADCVTALARFWKQGTIVSPTRLCLSLFLPIGLEVSLPAKEKVAACLCRKCFEAA